MFDSALLLSPPEQGVRVSDPQLPPFTDTLTFTQRHPRVLVAAGLVLTVAAGITGVVAGLGGAA